MRRAFVVSLILGALAGCGETSGPERGAIEGKVSLNGTAIENGTITFRPIGDTKGPSTGAVITQGGYRLSAAEGPVVGRNRVEIYAPVKSGKQVPAPMGNPGEMTDEIIELVPARYNSQSTLEQDVKLGGNNQDFTLTTQD